MLRKTFIMKINNDSYEEYIARHSPIWPELKILLKEHGVHNYSIWLDRERGLLFANLDIESEDRWLSIAETDTCKRWWAWMKDIMSSNEDNSPITWPLEQVFYME